jgi:Phage integrase, N-terminal SAM-like domain
VHWVSEAVPTRMSTHPILDEWADLADREEQMRIKPGDPFMLDPNHHVDARLTRFFSRSGFVQLAKSTKLSYTNDYRVFFDFLWLRGKYWDAAEHDDLLDFEDWRRRSARNPARISGAKWNRELAALQRLYRWGRRPAALGDKPLSGQDSSKSPRRLGRNDRCLGEGCALKQRALADAAGVSAVA